MSHSILAVYENGIFRPLEPLILPENQKVKLHILTEPIVDKAEQNIQSLVKSGLLTPPSKAVNSPSISKLEKKKLADALAQASKQTLSKIVIEEREQC